VARVENNNGNFEKCLRKFKKIVQAEGLVQEMRDRECFIKKSEKKKKAKAAARNRWNKKLAESKPERYSRR